MKTFILLILSCASMYGADTGFQVITTARTNSMGDVRTLDVFTRDGRTNLVRLTGTHQGKAESQNARFFHDKVLVGEFWSDGESSGFFTEAGSPYSLMSKEWTGKGVSQAFICTSNRIVVDYFNATNGIFYPATRAQLQHAQKMTADMSKTMSPK